MVKDHRYDYIETGSLLSIKKNTQGIVIPSEETRITMYPMDYEEFRWAMGDTATVPLLCEALQNRQPLGDAVTRKLMHDFRLYMLVGGMPQAVSTYLGTNNLTDVDTKKREIIKLPETVSRRPCFPFLPPRRTTIPPSDDRSWRNLHRNPRCSE